MKNTEDAANPVRPAAWNILDTCEQLGKISTSKLYAMRAAGEIEIINIGGKSIVTDDELQRVLAANRAATQARAAALASGEPVKPGRGRPRLPRTLDQRTGNRRPPVLVTDAKAAQEA